MVTGARAGSPSLFTPSTRYFKNVEALGTVASLPGMGGVVEKAMAYAPPFLYSHVTGITSPTGAEAEGWLITVGGTPKEMLAHPGVHLFPSAGRGRHGPQARCPDHGPRGLHQVVGDAGVTVAKQAPLPVTTGNSYSASGALWAACGHAQTRDRRCRRRWDHSWQGHGRRASGAIGSVCAAPRLVTDELWLVSPETAKLLALKGGHRERRPRAVVHVATDPSAVLSEMDVIVTATSAAGNKVLDIMKVKPGCVITDVARPLDMSAEDVAMRPDVLVIESGEIELPGDVHMRDIGLPKGSPTPALAETVVLAPRADTRRSPSGAISSGPRSGDLSARPQTRDEARDDLGVRGSIRTRTSPASARPLWRRGPGSPRRRRPRPDGIPAGDCR